MEPTPRLRHHRGPVGSWLRLSDSTVRICGRRAPNAATGRILAAAQRPYAVAVTAAADPATSRPDSPDPGPTERVFSLSVVVSGIRCLLAYVLFPWLLPAAGIALRVGSGLGLAIGAVAIVFNVLSIRRFQRTRHRYRWLISSLNAGIIVLLAVLMVIDLNDVLPLG